MQIVIYARKSTESDDRQVQSLEDQIRALMRIADSERLDIIEIIQESKSAKAPGMRPEFNRMLSMIYAGQVDGILTWAINRLSRNPVDGGQLAYMLQLGKLQMIRTADRTYLPDDNALLLSIENGISTAYLQDLSRNVTRGMKGKIERGWYASKAPLGYLNNPITREIDVDPGRFQIVRGAWQRLIHGHESIRAIHRHLLSTGITVSNRQGREQPPSYVTIYKMFKNPFYKGLILYKGELYPGKHEPMITPGEFTVAQLQIKATSSKRKALSARFPLSGVFTCEDCGCAIVAEMKRKHYKGTGRIAQYTYYHCSGHRGCSKRSLTERYLETQVREMLEAVKIPRFFGEWLKDALFKSLKTKSLDSDLERGIYEQKLESLERKNREITLMKLGREISESEYQELRMGNEQEREICKEQIAVLTETRSRIVHLGDSLIDAGIEAGELPGDGSYLSVAGAVACRVGDHTLSRGMLNLKPDPFYKEIAIFEPPKSASGVPKIGDLVPLNSPWWALVETLLNLLIVSDMQQPATSMQKRRK